MKQPSKVFDLKNISSSVVKIKYATCKEAIKLSKEAPKKLYKSLDFFY